MKATKMKKTILFLAIIVLMIVSLSAVSAVWCCDDDDDDGLIGFPNPPQEQTSCTSSDANEQLCSGVLSCVGGYTGYSCSTECNACILKRNCDSSKYCGHSGEPQLCSQIVAVGQDTTCNGIDDDCDGNIDNGASWRYYYRDADGDSYGNPSNQLYRCSQPSGYVTNNQDCNDIIGVGATIHPGATEVCGDGIDQDCSDSDLLCDANEDCYNAIDDDSDGYVDACDLDCNGVQDIQNAAASPYEPTTEVCDDAYDNDCDGYTNCTDSNCSGDPVCDVCVPTGDEVCGDGIDNDCVGGDEVCVAVNQGIFTSRIFDTTGAANYTMATWTSSEEVGATWIAVKARTGNTQVELLGKEWITCPYIANGNSIIGGWNYSLTYITEYPNEGEDYDHVTSEWLWSTGTGWVWRPFTNSCVTNLDQYVQYMVELNTNDVTKTPIFYDMDIDYEIC